MSIAKDLIFEELDGRCAECGEEFPEHVKNKWIAIGLRKAAAMIPGGMIEKGKTLSHSNPDVRAIYSRAQELDPK